MFKFKKSYTERKSRVACRTGFFLLTIFLLPDACYLLLVPNRKPHRHPEGGTTEGSPGVAACLLGKREFGRLKQGIPARIERYVRAGLGRASLEMTGWWRNDEEILVVGIVCYLLLVAAPPVSPSSSRRRYD